MTTRDELMGNLPLQYFDGPDYCTVKDATGGDFALTVQPELLKEMEAALTATAPGEQRPVAGPACRCHDDVSRKFCLDKDRCTPIAEAQSSTPPPPAPGIKEAFELFNGIVGSPDASGLVTVKIHKDCLARIHNIAAAPSRPDAGGVREAARNVASWLRAALDCELWHWDADQREAAEDDHKMLLAALSEPTDASNASAVARLPDWGQIVQILLRCMDATIKNETSREQAERMANELLEKYPALSKPADTPNVSAEARLREALARGLIGDRSEPDGYWIDIKFQTQEDMREARSAIKAWRVDAIKKSLAAVGGEAKKSEGLLTGELAKDVSAASKRVAERKSESSAQYRKAVDDANRMNDKGEVPSSDPTADVTVWPAKCHDTESCSRHMHCMYVGCAYHGTDIKPAVRAIDAFTVGRR